MQKQFQNLVAILKKARGNPVPLSVLSSSRILTSAEGKSPQRLDQRRNQRRNKRDSSSKAPGGILADLESYGLITIKNNQIYPKYPFLIDARLSVAPNGLGFGMGSFEKDILVPPGKRGGANHRDKVLIEILDIARDRYEGKVVSIVEPFTTNFLSRVKSSLDNSNHLINLIDLPDAPSGVLKNPGKFTPGTYLIVEETGESREIALGSEHAGKHGNKYQRPYYRECQVYRLISEVPEKESSSDHMRIAAKFNIPISFESEIVPRKRDMNKLEKSGMKDSKRVNLKKLYACTIDGADSKDFDDAVSYEKKGDQHILYVHIADVSHYIPKDTPLDLEAYKRGNSYYLKNSVFPMLPPILSEDFCSLRPKTKRLSFTCEMRYDQNGELLDYKLYKSIIYLGKRFTYEDAEKHIDKPGSPLKDIWELVKKLHTKRVAAGKIELNIRETNIIVDAHGRITEMSDKARLRSHRLVEECMLSANICTAHFLRKNKIPGIFRVHDPMPASGLDKINAFLKLYGFNFQIKSLHFEEVQKTIKRLEGSEVEEVFNYILLRSFAQAAYKNVPLGHWGLGFSDYTHFTSPIRRFSDLVVHRQLHAYLNNDELPYNKKQLEAIGAETSRLERVAMDAEKTMIRLISLRYFREKIGQTFSAFLSGFNPSGLFIQVQSPRIDGFIAASTFDRKGEVAIIDDFTVKIPKFSRSINLGQKLTVKLTGADWEKIQLSFEIINILK
ncbi:MAG: ribonuclease R [Spirochaetia bacterium]|nr:ribonuclease R [Spirochaetia bacterium]